MTDYRELYLKSRKLALERKAKIAELEMRVEALQSVIDYLRKPRPRPGDGVLRFKSV